jgi:hypothetical protein
MSGRFWFHLSPAIAEAGLSLQPEYTTVSDIKMIY